MMLSHSASNGVAAASSLIRNTPTRSMSAFSLGSRAPRCRTAASASNRTLVPWIREERPGMGALLYPSGSFPHTPGVDLAQKLRIKPGRKVDLGDFPTDATPGYKQKPDMDEILRDHAARMADLQYLMFAENKRSLLIVLQAMDTGGKDGTIRHVMTGLNPAGVQVTSFKVPSEEERAHDFLWRIHHAVPRRGDFGIFNRSHYEDVIVVRVHELVPRPVWEG